MKALVVYESYWGNTEVVARAIARGIGDFLDVQICHVSDAGDAVLDVDLVVAGGPTHVLSMSRTRTRAGAVRQGAAQGDPGRGLREWLAALPSAGQTAPVFTFDTRLRAMRHLPGSAARSAAKALRRRGYSTPGPAHSFYVVDVAGPLVDGESERAYRWGRELAGATLSAARPA